MLMTNGETLIYLISCALNGKAAEKEYLKGVDHSALLKQAKRHYVSALVSYAFELSGAADEAFKRESDKALRKMMLLDHETKKLCAFLNDERIRFLKLKGTVIKDFYPEPYLRERSDVDILIGAEDTDAMNAFFADWQKFEETDHHVSYRKPPLYNFEVHTSLFDSDERMSEYYGDVFKRLLPSDGCEYAFKNEDLYIYFIAHAEKHYSIGGTGLRTLADCYVLRKRFKDMDEAYIKSELDKTGLLSYASLLESTATKLLSGSGDDLTAEEKSFADETVKAGAFGTYNGMISKKIEKTRGKSRKKYVIGRIFPDKERIQKAYPFSARHPWAVPFCRVHRVTVGAMKRRKDIKKEVKTLRKIEKDKNK